MSTNGNNASVPVQYEVNINGKWCLFYPGHTNLFDEFEENYKFDITTDITVYGRAITDFVCYRPVYMYHTFKTCDIRIKNK